MRLNSLWTWLLAAVLLAGCSTSGDRAPIIDRDKAGQKSGVSAEQPPKKSARPKDWRPQIYVVQKGDTLYSIALNYGFDYHELAELNGISNPRLISIGQEIRLFPGKPGAAAPVTAEGKPIENLLKEQPKLVKYAYSEAALALIEKGKEPEEQETSVAKAEGKPQPKPEAVPDSKPEAVADSGDESDEAALEWAMPAQGKLLAQFSESANRKGIDIAGKLGDPVLASASGKVVYSGSGLRGYGKLVIIKHNKTYLSAYAHNNKILVKEGQSVTRGQKIAEMGSTDADQVKLHFEVRRLGKPVDPAKYLPPDKS